MNTILVHHGVTLSAEKIEGLSEHPLTDMVTTRMTPDIQLIKFPVGFELFKFASVPSDMYIDILLVEVMSNGHQMYMQPQQPFNPNTQPNNFNQNPNNFNPMMHPNNINPNMQSPGYNSYMHQRPNHTVTEYPTQANSQSVFSWIPEDLTNFIHHFVGIVDGILMHGSINDQQISDINRLHREIIKAYQTDALIWKLPLCTLQPKCLRILSEVYLNIVKNLPTNRTQQDNLTTTALNIAADKLNGLDEGDYALGHCALILKPEVQFPYEYIIELHEDTDEVSIWTLADILRDSCNKENNEKLADLIGRLIGRGNILGYGRELSSNTWNVFYDDPALDMLVKELTRSMTVQYPTAFDRNK